MRLSRRDHAAVLRTGREGRHRASGIAFERGAWLGHRQSPARRRRQADKRAGTKSDGSRAGGTAFAPFGSDADIRATTVARQTVVVRLRGRFCRQSRAVRPSSSRSCGISDESSGSTDSCVMDSRAHERTPSASSRAVPSIRASRELSASPTCLPNGPASTTCSDFLRRNRHSNRVSASRGLRFRETGFRGQKNAQKRPADCNATCSTMLSPLSSQKSTPKAKCVLGRRSMRHFETDIAA
jgi:hypothetical protein